MEYPVYGTPTVMYECVCVCEREREGEVYQKLYDHEV